MRKDTNNDKSKRIAQAFTLVTALGAIGVGVALMLSEMLYPEIEDFFACPPWYQAFLWVSLAVAVVGMIGCAIFKKSTDGKTIDGYKAAEKVYLGVTLTGVIITTIAAFGPDDNRVFDYAICIGGALTSVGVFLFFGTAVGVARSRRQDGYASLVAPFCADNKDIRLTDPAPLTDIIELEKYLGCMLPTAMCNFYKETDGDGDLMFSAKETKETTELVRRFFTEFCPDVARAVFFGGNGCGDYYCYLITDGNIDETKIYCFLHEDPGFSLCAESLPELVYMYYNGYLSE